MSLQDLFGDVIYSYTRAQAIEDGVLVEVTGELAKIARQHYKYPFAMTAEVHSIIQQAVDNPKTCNDYNGVWADIIWMSRCNVLNRPNNRTILFSVLITGTDKEDDVYKFKLVCVPSDDASPCMTLMLPEQD